MRLFLAECLVSCSSLILAQVLDKCCQLKKKKKANYLP